MGLLSRYHPVALYIAPVKVPVGGGIPNYCTASERNFTSQLADSHSHSFDTAGCGFQSAVHGPVVCPAHAGV